jgi:hypothetical protein
MPPNIKNKYEMCRKLLMMTLTLTWFIYLQQINWFLSLDLHGFKIFFNFTVILNFLIIKKLHLDDCIGHPTVNTIFSIV